MTVRINDPEAGARIAELATTHFIPGYDVCMSSHDGSGAFLGGCILTDFTGASMTMHVGGLGSRWVTRELLTLATHYPFVQLGCTSLIGPIASYHSRSQDLAKRMGFRYETRIAQCLPGGADMLIFRLWREECRWHRRPLTQFRSNVEMEG